MLPRFKNDLLTLISESGLSESLFVGEETRESGGESVFTITLRHTPMRFSLVSKGDRGFAASYTTYNQSTGTCSEDTLGYAASNKIYISDIKEKFGWWLAQHAGPYWKDFSPPDLWTELAKLNLNKIEPVSHGDATSQFTEAERAQIKIGIENYQITIINEFHPSAQQLEYIETQLKYLSDGVDRLNQFDWRNIAFSIVIGIIINLTVDTQGGQRLLQLFDQALQNAMHLLH